jgi:uncharacterized protein (DUF488 family)
MTTMTIKVVTIGVYGFDEERFFQQLVAAGIDAFCDIRARRGMRGATYAFVNSTHLQAKLKALDIQYLHFKTLAPSGATRALQHNADAQAKIAKRKRDRLSDAYVAAYHAEVLDHFDVLNFLKQFDDKVKTIALFCVESEPNACHRSLLAQKLTERLQVEVKHILP